MEGRFVGKSERLKIAQQIKNTHFKLGGDGPDY